MKSPFKITSTLTYQPERHHILDISNWTNAISSAYRGRRKLLTELYSNILLEGFLYEAVDKRLRAICNAKITFQKDGEEVEGMWEFMDSPAFEELLKEIMLSKFYGKSIIELSFVDGFQINSIDRRHLDTLNKLILRDSGDTTGIPYENDSFLLNIGEDKDLGLLARMAPYAIFKRNGGADYAQFCELFGIPQLIGKYDPDDENGQREMEDAFKKRGAGASMTLSNKASVDAIHAPQGNGSIHKDFLEYFDKQILITSQGQTMTTTDGTSLAQAKVHAETEDDLQLADKRFVMRVLNHELKPRLEKRGYPVAGGFFNFVEQKNNISSTEKLNIAERVNQITIDGVDDNYFYEEFGLPRGKKTKEKPEKQGENNMLEQEEDEEVESVIDNEEEKNKKQPKKRKIKAKELSLFKRMMNFFAHAPR